VDERMRRILESPLLVGVEPAVDFEVVADLAYTDDGDAGPRLDLVRPRSAAAPRPAWVFVHGGPLPPTATALPNTRNFRFFGDYAAIAAACGRAGVVLGHRLLSIEAIARSEADLRRGIDWLRDHAEELGIDADRLSLWIFSGAGVHLPSLLARPPAGVTSLVAFYPVLGAEVMAAVMGRELAAGEGSEAFRAGSLATAPPRLFVARAALDHPALNAALDRFVAELAGAPLELELVTHPRGQHGFELLDDERRTRELVESALRFLVRGESEHEPLPRVVRPAPAAT
jgi:acetyl esterase/lipase